MPKYATVDRSVKFHDGYPIVASPRLLANANPNTSRYRRGLLTATEGRAETPGAAAKACVAAMASYAAALSMTGGPLSLNFRSTALSGAAAGTGDDTPFDGLDACTGAAGMSTASTQTNAMTKCRNRCEDICKTTGTLGPMACRGQPTLLRLEDRPFGSRPDQQRISREHTLSIVGLGRRPGLQSSRHVHPLDRERS